MLWLCVLRAAGNAEAVRQLLLSGVLGSSAAVKGELYGNPGELFGGKVKEVKTSLSLL